MKLKEALELSGSTKHLGREAWVKDGCIMKLVSSAKTVEEIKFSLNLTEESLNADDWNIYEVRE